MSQDAEVPRLPALQDEVPRAGSARRTEDAHRFARLLVSNIRLYHEEDVILGRVSSDIRERLEEAISSARGVYRRRFDDERIFDSEVVRILAGGDARRLG